MKAREINLNISDLHKYMAYMKQTNANISLNEFIQRSLESDEDIVVNFKNIKFNEENSIDLSGANLSGCKLENVEFSGKYVILKDVDLRGATLAGSKFTDYISLSGTNLGSIVLSNKIFENCQLENTKYDATNPKIIMIAPTDEQIKDYLLSDKKQSLNEYLSIRSIYPEHFKIISNLSKMTIDERFSGANLNGSNLEGAIITGEIRNLSLRDCYTHKTKFSQCNLIEPDLRGTSLATNSMFGWGFEAAIFEGIVKLTEPRFSFGSSNLDEKQNIDKYSYGSSNLDIKKNIDKAKAIGLLPEEGSYDLTVEGKAIFDPCYKKGSEGIIAKYVQCNREDLESYLDHCKKQSHASNKKQSFKNFIKAKLKITETDFIADFAGADLSNLKNLKQQELRNMQFENCNFGYANLSGNIFNHTIFKDCSFAGAKLSEKKAFLSFSWMKGTNPASLHAATLENCDLTYALANDVVASEAHFTNVTGVNLVGEKLNINEATMSGISLQGACLANVEANKLKQKVNFYGDIISPNNFSYADCRNGKFHEADLNGAYLNNGNFSNAEFIKFKGNYADLHEANLSSVKVKDAELRYANAAKANINNANLNNAIVYGANFAGIKGEASAIEGIDWSEALKSDEVIKLGKQQNIQTLSKKTRSYYDKWTAGLVMGASILTTGAFAALFYASPIAAIILITNPIVMIAAATITSVIILDRVIAHSFDYIAPYLKNISIINKLDLSNGIGITSSISNILGAKKLFERRPDIAMALDQKNVLSKEEQQYKKLHKEIAGYEHQIKEASKSKTSDKIIELPAIKKPERIKKSSLAEFGSSLIARMSNNPIPEHEAKISHAAKIDKEREVMKKQTNNKKHKKTDIPHNKKNINKGFVAKVRIEQPRDGKAR